MAEDFRDSFILEPDKSTLRLCAHCFKENNLDRTPLKNAGWTLSDGICVRHMSEMYQMAGFDDSLTKQALKKIETLPDFRGHVRDLSDPKNKPFVDWLKNPRPSPTAQKQATPA